MSRLWTRIWQRALLSVNALRGLAALGAAVVLVAIAAGLLIPGAGWLRLSSAQEAAVTLPAPAADVKAPADAKPQTAVLAGGCFWGVQAVYQHVKGVQQVLSGYAGGEANTAHYEMVGSGRTGHAESVEIVFDPKQISYGEILRIFFSVAHNPTELDRQGPDWGPQYRSAIFYANPEQQRVAQAYIAQLDQAQAFPKKIVTRVDALKQFYPAEDYHQDYLILHPTQPYIVYNDQPKIQNLKRVLPKVWRDTPVTVAANAKR
jgi:peptide-methionine (S)-S-oxide reductase